MFMCCKNKTTYDEDKKEKFKKLYAHKPFPLPVYKEDLQMYYK